MADKPRAVASPAAGTAIDVAGLSHVGLVRPENEDQYLIAGIHKMLEIVDTSIPDHERDRLVSGKLGNVLVVADGVGGHAAGAQASSVAVESTITYVTKTMPCFFRMADSLQGDVQQELDAAIRGSHDAVLREAAADQTRRGMASTLTMAYLLWPRAFIVHVGDSRAYLLQGSELTRITRDQTYAQDMVDKGMLEPDQLDESPWSHVLSSALGAEAALTPVISNLEMAHNSSLLLCTDGLTKHVDDGAIRDHLQQGATAEECCRRLVAAALDGGGSDNVTVVVARLA